MTVQRLRLHRVHADILPSLRVRACSQCHFILSNIGLFHVIYKTVNDFMQSKPSHLNEPHQFFFASMNVLFLLLKCLLNELNIRNVVYMFIRKYVVIRTVFDKNKGIKTRKKEIKNKNDKLKQNETNSN